MNSKQPSIIQGRKQHAKYEDSEHVQHLSPRAAEEPHSSQPQSVRQEIDLMQLAKHEHTVVEPVHDQLCAVPFALRVWVQHEVGRSTAESNIAMSAVTAVY